MTDTTFTETVVDTDISPEEAHFYHTLMAFEDIVRLYGMDEIMNAIDDDVYMAIFDHIMPPDEDEDDFGK